MTTKPVILEPVKQIGQLTISRRKNHDSSTPRYVVGLGDRLLEDFQYLRNAERWCGHQAEGQETYTSVRRETGMHIIITGNPVDGLEFYGPFTTGVEAVEFANTDAHLPDEWWIAPLCAVEELNPPKTKKARR